MVAGGGPIRDPNQSNCRHADLTQPAFVLFVQTFGYLVNPTSRVMTRAPIEPRENTRRSPRTIEAV